MALSQAQPTFRWPHWPISYAKLFLIMLQIYTYIRKPNPNADIKRNRKFSGEIYIYFFN